MKKHHHGSDSIARAATLLFMVRGQMRSCLAQGKRLDPYKWLRIETLVYIRDHAGSSMKDVAAYLSITAPSATSVIGTLVKEGLVERRADTRDKRAVRLHLSKKGKVVLDTAVRRGIRLLGPLFSPLSATDLSVFTRLLERIEQGAKN